MPKSSFSIFMLIGEVAVVVVCILAALELAANPGNVWAWVSVTLIGWIGYRKFFPPKKIKNFERFVMPDDVRRVDNRKIKIPKIT